MNTNSSDSNASLGCAIFLQTLGLAVFFTLGFTFKGFDFPEWREIFHYFPVSLIIAFTIVMVANYFGSKNETQERFNADILETNQFLADRLASLSSQQDTERDIKEALLKRIVSLEEQLDRFQRARS